MNFVTQSEQNQRANFIPLSRPLSAEQATKLHSHLKELCPACKVRIWVFAKHAIILICTNLDYLIHPLKKWS